MWEKIYDITDFLWGTPLMILMVGVGLYLSVALIKEVNQHGEEHGKEHQRA